MVRPHRKRGGSPAPRGNILTLVVQTKAMVCATIFYGRSEGKSQGRWDLRIRTRKPTHFTSLFESV